MKMFRLGLNVARRVRFVLDIKAKDIHLAAKEWARITGHNDGLFNEIEMTYFGWPIVKTKLPALQRKAEYPLFHSKGVD